jgi:hypothetical protein
MLREEVVEAVAEGKFAVYPVATVDEGVELLAGVPAAEIHARVEARLQEFAEQARAFAQAPGKKPWRAAKKK